MTLTPEQQEKNRKLCMWLFRDRSHTTGYGYYTTFHNESWDAIHSCLEKLTEAELCQVIISLRDKVSSEGRSIWFYYLLRATKSQWIDALCEGLNL